MGRREVEQRLGWVTWQARGAHFAGRIVFSTPLAAKVDFLGE